MNRCSILASVYKNIICIPVPSHMQKRTASIEHG